MPATSRRKTLVFGCTPGTSIQKLHLFEDKQGTSRHKHMYWGNRMWSYILNTI